jgi:hypothetical protein
VKIILAREQLLDAHDVAARAAEGVSSSRARICASQGDDAGASRSCSRRIRRTVLRESLSRRLISRRL